jgi:hypothetical protein
MKMLTMSRTMAIHRGITGIHVRMVLILLFKRSIKFPVVVVPRYPVLWCVAVPVVPVAPVIPEVPVARCAPEYELEAGAVPAE